MDNHGQTWHLDFTLNDEHRQLEIDPHITLLELLRMKLGLTGTKGACLEGECGSCTVLVDGRPMNSCLILAAQMQGREVTTIEGLAKGANLHPLQRKFIEHGAVQCGYCTPGLIMAAKDILDHNAQCTGEEFLRALEGNLCRCTGYNKILSAVRDAWRETQTE
ncbi:MAG: (2Fe-2S)-binding protein [bacterium]|nr:(2Fe-2S)-binding protein [Candidatus Sumerlaeota bacterium]